MNETIQTLLTRRSIRAYEDKPVSKEDLTQLVECGRYAATGRGLQPWHFSVVTDRAVLDAISQANAAAILADPDAPETMKESVRAGGFDTFRGAPAAIFVSGENDNPLTVADCANATQNMAVAAKAMGLGSCYLASHKISLLAPGGETLMARAGIPAGYLPHFALAVGHPAEDPQPAPRREGCVTFVE